MQWRVVYHPQVRGDLRALGRAQAKRILKAIEKRVQNGQPHNTGKPLGRDLVGCRRIRVGATRIVCKVNLDRIEVLVIAVGPRRDDVIYQRAQRRVQEP